MKNNNLKIIRADKLGFCFGVKEAVETSLDLLKKESKVFILGMLVHNSYVIKDLEDRNAIIIEEDKIESYLDSFSDSDHVIVRAHGTTKDIYKKLEKSKAIIHDAACIFVKKSRNKLIDLENDGYKIIFIGEKDHPEVKGITSYGKNVKIFSSLDKIKEAKFEPSESYALLSQTTFSYDNFFKIKEYLESLPVNIKTENTICGTSYEKAVKKLASEVDITLLIGSHSSSNSKKLFWISKQVNEKTYFIENVFDIKKIWFKNVEIIGIAAGASTPESLISKIEYNIKGMSL